MKNEIDNDNIDNYLALIPEKNREVLQKYRDIINEMVPLAAEVISYQVPVFKYKGSLVGFASFKYHCSLFVMSKKVMADIREDIKGFKTATATIRFTPDKPLPEDIVRRIVLARVQENEDLFNKKIMKKKKKT